MSDYAPLNRPTVLFRQCEIALALSGIARTSRSSESRSAEKEAEVVRVVNAMALGVEETSRHRDGR